RAEDARVGGIVDAAVRVDDARARVRDGGIRHRQRRAEQARALVVGPAVRAHVPDIAHAAVDIRAAVEVAIRVDRARDPLLARRAGAARALARPVAGEAGGGVAAPH